MGGYGKSAPGILFDDKWYLSSYPDVKKSGIRAFSHYLKKGAAQGLNPHPLFSTKYYIDQVGEEGLAGDNPLIHFCKVGKHSPHPAFDTEWYLRNYPDVATAGLNPLVHFLKYGAAEGRLPNQNFDTQWYLSEYHDVNESGMNPLIHYVLYGESEGRYRNGFEKDFSRHQNDLTSDHGISINLEGPDILQSPEGDLDRYIAEITQSGFEPPLDDSIRLLSFDVWDTLLRRKCHPDEIKLQSARFLYIECYSKLKPAFRGVPQLYKARINAENHAAPDGDFEYRFPDAIPLWLQDVMESGVSQDNRQIVRNALEKHEYDAELRATFADPNALVFLSKNKLPHSVFASDFYMSSDFLSRLLRDNGYHDRHIKGYSSSDLMKNKRSGQMFDQIIADFDIAPEEILHIGDNEHADVLVPSEQGIRTYHYKVPGQTSRYGWLDAAFRAHLSGDNAIHEQRLIELLEKTAATNRDPLRQLGARISPIAIGFVLNVIEQSKRFDAGSVFFFTREGVFLKSLYEQIVKQDPYLTTYAEPEVLEVSRISTFGASLQRVDADGLMRLWSQYSTQSPSALCRSLKLDAEAGRKIFEQVGIDFDKSIVYPWQDKDFMDVLNGREFQELASKAVSEHRALLQSYLRNKGVGVEGKSALVVDIGWRGTIQDNLCHLVSEHLHGCYLALFPFLNKQPENSSKDGWLYDRNHGDKAWEMDDVAPLEMLFNCTGGSVTGYLDTEDGVQAVRNVDPDEDRVVLEHVARIQQGIFDAVGPVIDYMALHGLTAADIHQLACSLAKELLSNPTAEFATAFFELNHNETFGTGEFDSISAAQAFVSEFNNLSGSALHQYGAEFLGNVRWPAGFLKLPEIREILHEDKSPKALGLPCEFHRSFYGLHSGSKKIGIYIPAPLVGSGGHRTIFNLAKKFASTGHEVFCFLEGEGAGRQVAYDYLGGARAFVTVGWRDQISLDLAIATIAHSAPFVASLRQAKHKAYLIQDMEALFNPAGDAYRIAEHSYTVGTTNFTIGNWISHVLSVQYDAAGIPAGLGIDTELYHAKDVEGSERETSICFLYQPEKPRRSPALGIEALRLVKARHPDTKIYVYGSDAPIHLDFEVENMGLIRDLAELNDLYNKCSIGLCISMSNPSRIPFEMMAAGVVPVDIYRYNNLMDYQAGTISLAYQSSASLAEAMCVLLEDSEKLQRHRHAGIEFAKTRSLDWEMDVIFNHSLALLNGVHASQPVPHVSYDAMPVLAKCDDTHNVKAFCDWQRRLASM